MMAHHHQTAIDASQAYLKIAKDAKMKAMAQKVVTDQQKEKKEMEDWQARSHSGGGHGH